MSSVDGRIDCAMTEKIDNTNAYYDALDQLQFDAVLEGRVSRQMHYALPEPFVAADETPIGKEAYHIAHPANATTWPLILMACFAGPRGHQPIICL